LRVLYFTMRLNIKNLSVEIENKKILSSISLDYSGNVLGVIGPSGCGKTTLLRALAGLQSAGGQIFLNEERLDDKPPAQRQLGLVTQDMTLFDHLTVRQNIAFPLQIRKITRHRQNRLTQDILRQFGIVDLADKFPQQISGGEKQRAAMARSLIYDPQLLLLDEPFAGLDAILRSRLLVWLKDRLEPRKLGTVFVSHNIREIEFLADAVLVLIDGQLYFFGSGQEFKNSSLERIRELRQSPV